MTTTDSLRLEIFKKQIKEEQLLYLNDLSDDELLKLLDSTVIANSPDSKSVRYMFLFHLLFCTSAEKKERIISQVDRLRRLEESLTKTEKTLIKFGLIHGFSSNNYRVELYRFIKKPISFNIIGSGRKIISSVHFRRIFYFAYNLVMRGKKNDRFPKH